MTKAFVASFLAVDKLLAINCFLAVDPFLSSCIKEKCATEIIALSLRQKLPCSQFDMVDYTGFILQIHENLEESDLGKEGIFRSCRDPEHQYLEEDHGCAQRQAHKRPCHGERLRFHIEVSLSSTYGHTQHSVSFALHTSIEVNQYLQVSSKGG